MRRHRSLNLLKNRSLMRDLAAQRLANASSMAEFATAVRAVEVAIAEPVRRLTTDAEIAAYVRSAFPLRDSK